MNEVWVVDLSQVPPMILPAGVYDCELKDVTAITDAARSYINIRTGEHIDGNEMRRQYDAYMRRGERG